MDYTWEFTHINYATNVYLSITLDNLQRYNNAERNFNILSMQFKIVWKQFKLFSVFMYYLLTSQYNVLFILYRFLNILKINRYTNGP